MTIMIRDVELMADVSDFCENFKDFSMFLGCPLRILAGITWRPRKEPPICNSKKADRYEIV
jgi:hypothetical protein